MNSIYFSRVPGPHVTALADVVSVTPLPHSRLLHVSPPGRRGGELAGCRGCGHPSSRLARWPQPGALGLRAPANEWEGGHKLSDLRDSPFFTVF